MKIKRKFLSIFLSILVCISIFKQVSLKSNATSSLNTFHISELNGYTVYEYDNPSALPNTFSVYWVYGGKVCHAPASKWLIVALNKKIGTTFTDNWFTDFFTYFTTQIMSASNIATDFFTGGVTRISNGNTIIGVAFGDLTGKTLETDISNNATIETPSNVVNVTYNILNNYLQANPITPPYIILKLFDKDNAINSIGNLAENQDWQNTYNSLNTYCTGNYIIGRFVKYTNVSYWQLINGTTTNRFSYADMTGIIWSTTTTNYNTLVNDFSLTEQNNIIEITDLLSYTSNINCICTDIDGNATTIPFTVKNTDDTTVGSGNASSYNLFVHQQYNKQLCIVNEGQVTIYQNNYTPLTIKNNTYSQNFYTSSNYKNYSVNNDNSFSATYNNVNNSNTTNQNIYNETKTTNNRNTTNNNYNIDNSVNDNSTTTIINNYYGDSSGGDNGGDNDDNDDPIWKALLKAIADFFEKIGDLIATLLTGIFSIFTSILDAITTITDDFTSITSFISSFFSWLPSPISSLIVLGLGLALICAFLTWFKK